MAGQTPINVGGRECHCVDGRQVELVKRVFNPGSIGCTGCGVSEIPSHTCYSRRHDGIKRQCQIFARLVGDQKIDWRRGEYRHSLGERGLATTRHCNGQRDIVIAGGTKNMRWVGKGRSIGSP